MNKFAKHWRHWIFAIIALPALAACANGPTFEQQAPPAISPQTGRIIIYRSQEIGMGIQPSVMLNGVAVGSAVPDGYFYLDRPPGDYKIRTSTEVAKELSLSLNAGQTVYVRLAVNMGILVAEISPELVNEVVAMRELPKMHFTNGPPPKEKAEKKEKKA